MVARIACMLCELAHFGLLDHFLWQTPIAKYDFYFQTTPPFSPFFSRTALLEGDLN